MMSAIEYRLKAAEARALALISHRVAMQDEFEAIAYEWDVLAAKADAMDLFVSLLPPE